MIQQIQIRRDTAATWTSENPLLASGEQGFETDTGKFKIGDGSTLWASLAYAAAAPLGADDNYVTDAEKTKLSNLSGTNTGDEDTASTLGLLQGAEADPTRIGAEYLPERLETQGIILSDSSAVALADGVIAEDAEGNLVRHDGVTVGGNRLYIADPLRINTVYSTDGVLHSTQTRVVELGSVRLTAAKAVAGTKMYVRGKVQGAWAQPFDNFVIRIAFENVAGNLEGALFSLDFASDFVSYEFQSVFLFSESAGLIAEMNVPYGGTKIVKDTGVASVDTCFENATDQFDVDNIGTVDAAQDVTVSLVTVAAGAIGAFNLMMDLEFLFE